MCDSTLTSVHWPHSSEKITHQEGSVGSSDGPVRSHKRWLQFRHLLRSRNTDTIVTTHRLPSAYSKTVAMAMDIRMTLYRSMCGLQDYSVYQAGVIHTSPLLSCYTPILSRGMILCQDWHIL